MANLTNNNLEEKELQELNSEMNQKTIKAKRIGSMYFLEKRDYLRPFDKLRYWIYRATDINPNKGRLSVWLVVSLIYNLVMTIMPLVAIVPIIMNYAAAPSMATDASSITESEFVKFNNMMGKYMYVEFVFSFILILDWCVRILYCDFKYPLVVGRWKSVFSYIFNPYNLYQIASAIVLIALFSNYGSIDNHYWFIDINVLGANYGDTKNHAQALYNSWNPGELIFVSIYIANVFMIVPRVVLAFKERTPFKSKVSLWATLKKRWKTPVIATVFLIVLLFVFSFLILKSEQSYYAEWSAAHPDQNIDEVNPNNYSSSPKNIWQSLWYCLITVTTVGYGQIIPQSPAGRVIAVVLVIVGISYYSFYSVFFVSTYTNFIDKKDQADQDKAAAAQKKQDQEQLVQTIKSEFVQELLKYGVIDQQKYQQVEQAKMIEENKQQKILNAQANKKAKNMLNNNLLIQKEESRLKGWIKTYSLDLAIKKKAQEHIPSQEELSDTFDYEIINSPDLQENYQAIMVKLDSNIVNKIFNAQPDESINLFFKKVAPTYKVKKVIIVDKLLNTIVGEVSIKDILLTNNEIAWDKFGNESGFVQQMFEVEFSDVSLIYIYLIMARKKYLQPKSLEDYDINKDQLVDFVFLKQKPEIE